jgi:mRNA interferase MazF
MIRGEVWQVTLDPVQGSEQAGTKPVLVFQADPLILHLRTVVIIPVRMNLRWARFPFCVAVSAGDGGLVSDSVALCHQIRACDKARLLKRLGQLADAPLVRIEQAVQVTLGM